VERSVGRGALDDPARHRERRRGLARRQPRRSSIATRPGDLLELSSARAAPDRAASVRLLGEGPSAHGRPPRRECQERRAGRSDPAGGASAAPAPGALRHRPKGPGNAGVERLWGGRRGRRERARARRRHSGSAVPARCSRAQNSPRGVRPRRRGWPRGRRRHQGRRPSTRAVGRVGPRVRENPREHRTRPVNREAGEEAREWGKGGRPRQKMRGPADGTRPSPISPLRSLPPPGRRWRRSRTRSRTRPSRRARSRRSSARQRAGC
jgi:arginine/serine-rich splicing factor 4/5/6/transcription factor SPN1